MGNCITWAKGKNERQPVTLLAVGLDNAGKTTTVQGIKGDVTADVAPTIGFASLDVKTGKYEVKIFDLGGGARIRGIWQNYMAEAHGIIYVIDSSDMERMDECRQAFDSLVSDSRLRGKPVLILANKQDKANAVDELDLCNLMNLDEVVNRNECYSKVVLCSALPMRGNKKPKNRKLDRGITNGYLWLLDVIGKDYENLQERIKKDVDQQKQKEAEERLLRIERVRRRREERERQENEEAATEPISTDIRPSPEGISHHELPNDSPRVDNGPDAAEVNSPMQENSGLGANLIDDDDVTETAVVHDQPNTPLPTLPGAVVTNTIATNDAEAQNLDDRPIEDDNADQYSDNPRTLSAASLRELVRDTPTPLKESKVDEPAPDEPQALAVIPPVQPKPESIISLQNENYETASVSSGNIERKKKKKKRKKHRKQNRIDPGIFDDNTLSESSQRSEPLRGKLTPIKTASDLNSNSTYGKLPPISNTPNFDSDVEL